jgi:TIR domain
MTGANDGADLGAQPGQQWDVALSFAGAQRDYVGQVAGALKARGVRCFYDADEQVRLWGTYLAEELPRIYARESAAVVVFISADYVGRDWTRLERRAAFSRAVAEAGVYVLPARFDDSELPGLLPDVVAVDLRRYTPGQFADLIVAKLAISPSPPPDGAGRVPAGAVRVGEADPRRLGVHAAISVPGVPDDVLPEYVPRDADAAEHGVRARVAAAAERGGFVLLVGGSSVGKTRCAAEAVRALLPDWWLVHPSGPAEVAALAAAPPARTVVWLDELQRYLGGEHGLTGGVVRALLNAPHPAVIIGTLWPDRYTAYTTPAPGGTDPHAREREVLDLADVVRIDPEFSPTEQDRAADAAARDPRLRVALDLAGYGLTQTLAAAPQLIARWKDAKSVDPYAWALLTAALDAARLGARAPLSADFLRAAAPGYCTSQQQAEASENWFGQALAYATTKLYGAAAALSPAGAGMGQVAGYSAADYLVQHASRERRYERVPASTWDAVLRYICDPADAARLADSAESRLLYGHAIALYRHAADAGDRYATWQLADLLARRGDVDGLRARADAGDEAAAVTLAKLLAKLLAERGDVDGLHARADAGDWDAAELLARLQAERGDLDRLRSQADAHNWGAAVRLAELLVQRGDVDGLRARADGGDRAAAVKLANLLAERGDLEQLRARADADGEYAAGLLAKLLAERGDLDEAERILRSRADIGDGYAARRLAELLAERGDLDGAEQVLRGQADARDAETNRQLAELLAERGDLEQLRAWADGGDERAAVRLGQLLIQRGDLEGCAAGPTLAT